MGAVVLAVAVAALLVVAAVVGPANDSPWLRAVYLVAVWFGPVLIAVLAWRHAGSRLSERLGSWLRTTLTDIVSGPVVHSLPPRTVLSMLLKPVYGNRPVNDDLLTAFLGGAGRDPGRSDTAVSRSTSAVFRLESIDDTNSRTEVTWTHDYSSIRENYKFIVFATCEPSLVGLLVSERRFPLFELWSMDEDNLADFAPTLQETTQFGITYTDTAGTLHTVEPTAMQGDAVKLGDFDQYVRLSDRVDRTSISIVSFDLHHLVADDHVLDSIRTMSIRTTFKSNIDQRYVTWSPPHPCFVETVVFDVTELPRGGQKLDYLVLTSTVAKAGLSLAGGWQEGADTITVPIGSWMLPGHGVTLVWRPREEG